jgi:MYXO-CTERM domain-containing protein
MVADYGLPKVNALEDNQVAQAFARLEAAEPKLWADMKAGVDPNSDPTFTESAPPQPQYGCAASKVPTGPGSSWPTALGLAALAVTLRRRRSR